MSIQEEREIRAVERYLKRQANKLKVYVKDLSLYIYKKKVVTADIQGNELDDVCLKTYNE